MTTSTLSLRLKHARLSAGLSQEELGIRIGLEPASASTRMNRYELGKRVPAPELIERVAAELNLPAAYFYAYHHDEAELLQRFHHLSDAGKTKLMIYINKLEQAFSYELDLEEKFSPLNAIKILQGQAITLRAPKAELTHADVSS